MADLTPVVCSVIAHADVCWVSDFKEKSLSNAEIFMLEARQAVAAGRKETTKRISTMAWYAGRKYIQKAPLKALTAATSLVNIFPGAGTALTLAVETAVSKVDAARKRNKRAAYAAAAVGNTELDSLRKSAKADAKDQKNLIAKIDSNLVKLKDAIQRSETANVEFLNSAIREGQSLPTKDASWKMACAIYERQHYEDKLHVFVETMKERLQSVENYIDEARKQTIALEEDMTKNLDEMERVGITISDQVLMAPSSPLGYQELR